MTTPASTVNRPEILGATTGSPSRTGWRATGSDANISAVMQPKGNGALIGQFPDNAATGGNGRGVSATDWQTTRTAATQVASGTAAVIAGGSANTASAAQSSIAGGSSNSATATDAAIGGGSTNSATAVAATVAGGSTNLASGTVSWIPGGFRASTRGVYGRGAWAANRIAASGDAQCGEHHLLRQTTDATGTRLTADSGAANTTNTINLPNFGAYAGRLMVTAKATGTLDAAVWVSDVLVLRGNGVGTTTMPLGAGATIAPTGSNGTGSAWRIAVAADTTNGGIAITVTGAAATIINWSARFANVEVVTAS